MGEVTIRGVAHDGAPLTAMFAVDRGMNIMSYRKGAIEVIDQSTRPLFEERYAGLGAMIGPHFHHRNPAVIPPVKNEELFPHIARVKARGTLDPFSHGIGRYAPWKVESATEQEIRSTLSGSDVWNGVTLKELEGQDFVMSYRAKMVPEGLELHLSVKSDTESVVGLHTYYALGGGNGSVIARVKDKYVDKSTYKPIPSTWNYRSDHTLTYTLDQECDYGFHPFPDPLTGMIELSCPDRRVRVAYFCENEENSFQLWHPLQASFVCIEPLSAKDPRKPKLTISRLKILISVL
jgi:D-hexose-6-phosphate mutarotase